MRSLPAMFVLAQFLCLHGAEAGLGALHYRASLVFRGEPGPVEFRFTLLPTAVAETRNRVKKPRLGGWRLVQASPEGPSRAALLAKIEPLLYLAGPDPGLLRSSTSVRYGSRRCQVWQVPVPEGLQAYAYLVEVAPGLLALSYFSGRFEGGDLAGAELQLEGFHLAPGAAPAENGTALLGSLRRLAGGPEPPPEGGEERIED